MINSTRALEELNARDIRATYGEMSYATALERFTALWCYARELNSDFGENWMEDIVPDIAIARALNGLPPNA